MEGVTRKKGTIEALKDPPHQHSPLETKNKTKKDDGVEERREPIGGAPRSPASSVTLPAIGGRPKVETFDSTWKQLDAALHSAPPATLEAAIGQLGALGFTLSNAHDGRAKLVRGDFTLRIEEESIGSHPALRVELEGPGKKERAAVEMHGTMLPVELWDTMNARFDLVMKEFQEALEDHGKKPLPATFDALKNFIESGKSSKARKKEEAQDAEVDAALAKLTKKLIDLKKKGLAPRAIVVYTDGPDGAGKSSTGTAVLSALSAAGYNTGAAIFKAPNEKERGQHWLQRFRDNGVPEGNDQAMFWDRGPAGDTVYGNKTPAQVKEMAKDLKKFERDLAADGVLLFKVHIFADQEKQAETFGKRLARQSAADVIESELKKRGKLTSASAEALENIRSKIDGDDLRALVNFDDFQAKFLRFSKATGYTVIDATKRHAARLEIIQALSDQLDSFAKTAG